VSDGPGHVVLATSAAYADLPPDDGLLRDALARRGVPTSVRVWSDAAAWSGPPALVVLRSCWDYHLRLDEFLGWLTALGAAGHVVRNPPAVVRWNARKRYLLALAAHGVRIAPTLLLGADDAPHARARTAALVAGDAATWTDVVVKPEVSASAFETWRATLPLDDASAARLARGLAGRDLLVQAFQPEITARGETSLLFLGGTFSHAVVKRAAPGDFRVQAEHGGRSFAITADAALVDHAARILDAAAALAGHAADDLLYARVDVLADDAAHGAPTLMEVELVEPSLFLGYDAGAADRLAGAIVRHMEA
jgi:hypothetical protein